MGVLDDRLLLRRRLVRMLRCFRLVMLIGIIICEGRVGLVCNLFILRICRRMRGIIIVLRRRFLFLVRLVIFILMNGWIGTKLRCDVRVNWNVIYMLGIDGMMRIRKVLCCWNGLHLDMVLRCFVMLCLRKKDDWKGLVALLVYRFLWI